MTDIPQEVREAAARIAAVSELRPVLLSGEYDDHLYIEVCHAMFLAGKRAGMERAAEIADEWCADCSSIETNWDDGYYQASAGLAQAIRSENDGHG